MFFKKSICLLKRDVLFVLLFCALFFLFFLPGVFAATDEEVFMEFVKLENQLKEKLLSPDEFLKTILRVYIVKDEYHKDNAVYEIGDELAKKRNELVSMGLNTGANAGKFLKIVVSQWLPSEEHFVPLLIQKQEDLVRVALEKGAKFSDMEYFDMFGSLPSFGTAKLMLDNSFDLNYFIRLIFKGGAINFEDISKQNDLLCLVLKKKGDLSGVNIDFFKTLPSIEVAALMLANLYDPNSFLALVLDVHGVIDSSDLLFKQKELVQLALENGADPNYAIKLGKHSRCSSEIMELLFNNNYKKINPDVFCHYLWVVGRSYYDLNELSQLLDNPYLVLDKKYKNLNAKPAATPKIPRIIHHIWLTNTRQKKDISESAIENICKTRDLFFRSKGSFLPKAKQWEHIVWVNDKALIPETVKKLEEKNIQVREISEIEDHLKLGKKVRDLIKDGSWGMASDTLRYDLVNYLGGVYADVNFVFKRNIEDEIYKYDFFVQFDPVAGGEGYPTFENNFFGSKADHPILIEALNLVDRNFKNPPEYITILGQKQSNNIWAVTSRTTYQPFYTAYYKMANAGTIDVAYPSYYDYYSRDTSKAYNNDTVFVNSVAPDEGLKGQVEYATCGNNANIVVNRFRKYIQNNEICGMEHHNIGEDGKGLTWCYVSNIIRGSGFDFCPSVFGMRVDN